MRAIPLDAVAVLFLAGTTVVLAPWQIPWPLRAVGALLVLLYMAVTCLGATGEKKEAPYRVRLGLLIGLLLCLAVLPAVDMMRLRREQGPESYAHDGLVQLEAAITYLSEGRNPYAEDYFNTPLEYWGWDPSSPYVNPALYYLAYLPAMFLAGIPVMVVSLATLGWYDQRILYLLVFAAGLWAWGRLARDRTAFLLVLVVLGLNPLTVPYFIEGRNDVVIVSLVGLSLLALDRGRLGASGMLFGLACASKQSAWFYGPFLLLYVWGARERFGVSGDGMAGLREIARRWVLPGAVLGGAIILPFFAWDPGSFREDTISYLSGNVENNFPIRREGAYGLHVLLASPGVHEVLDAATSGPLAFLRPATDALKVTDPVQPYPFWIFQALFAFPMFVLALRAQVRRNTVAAALAGTGLTLLAFQYFSRFLHDNYIGFAATFLALAVLVREPVGVRPLAVPAVPTGTRGGMERAPGILRGARGRAVAGSLVLAGRRMLWAGFALWLALTVAFFGLRAASDRYSTAALEETFNGPPPVGGLDLPPGEAGEPPPYSLDGPPLEEYGRFLGSALRLDWGSSVASGRPIGDVLRVGLPISARIGVLAFALAAALGIPLGTLAAIRRGWASSLIASGATLAYGIPNLVLAILLLALSVYTVGLFPVPWNGRWNAYLLPVLVLGLGAGGYLARVTRTAVLEVLGQDYVRTARAKGLREGVIGRRHVLRNALPLVVAALGPTLGLLLSGSLLVEYAYQVPGVGGLLLAGFAQGDFPLILAGVAVYTAILLGASLAADVAAGVADPRRRGASADPAA